MKGITSIYLVLCLGTVALTFGKHKSFKVDKNIRFHNHALPNAEFTAGIPTTLVQLTTFSTEFTSPHTIPTNTTSRPTTLQPTQLPGPTCSRDYSCLDCNTARVCAPTDDERGFFEVKRFTCPTPRPWCDPSSGTCTASRPQGCNPHPHPVPGNFTCMRDGFYPNVNNCSQYFQCVADSSYLLECPPSSPYYAPYFQQCLVSGDYCANFGGSVCGLDGAKVLIRDMNNMFAYCDKNQVLAVDRCIGGYVLNLTSQNCEPSCPHAGLFPSDQDCAQYYRCNPRTNSPGDRSFIMTTNLTCPEGMGFLEEAFQCVNRSLVPNCHVQPEFFS